MATHGGRAGETFLQIGSHRPVVRSQRDGKEGEGEGRGGGGQGEGTLLMVPSSWRYPPLPPRRPPNQVAEFPLNVLQRITVDNVAEYICPPLAAGQ